MDTADRISEFRAYLESHLEEEKGFLEKKEKETAEFLNDYPLSRIHELSVEEYCLGTEKSKESLCYLLEFGKYRYTGFGIGGGSAKKYGVYFNKTEQCYKHGSDIIENIEEFWPQFSDELFRFLMDSSNEDNPIYLENYPLLQGMAMVLTKLLCLYYPQSYFSIGDHILS